MIAVIPDDVIRPRLIFSSSGICELIICSASEALERHSSAANRANCTLRRAGDHDHLIAQRFTAGFIKEWNVSKEKVGRIAMLFRLRHPLATNPRMKDLLKRASLGRVCKYYRPKFRSIQVAMLA